VAGAWYDGAVLTRGVLEELQRQLDAPAAAGADAALERGGRRARGAYFTPAPLASLVARAALAARLDVADVAWDADGAPALRVLDPAAGDGRFLAAAADALADRAAARGFGRQDARRAIVARCLVGFERDPKFAALSRARLPGAAIHCCEALLGAPDPGPVDVVVGNPPYQRSIHLARTDPALWRALRGRFAATSHGEWDLYGAFLERALAWTGDRGELGMVVPSRWLTASFAGPLRAALAGAGAVRALVDFGPGQVFAGATTYASLAFLSRVRQKAVTVLRRWDGGWRSGAVDAASLGAEPWRLAVGRPRALLDRLAGAGPTLGQVARIAKGAGTNADRVYVLEPRGDAGSGLVRVWSSALGEEVCVEAALCRPVYRGRDVEPLADAAPPALCLVPYDRDGRLYTPGELAARFPAALDYLETCRPRLDSREHGRFSGETFYRFGRPQNLALLGRQEPRVVVPDVAKSGRAVVDRRGAFVLDTAYVVVPEDGDYSCELLAAVLSSPMVALWLRETGVPLRGGYVRMKTAYLRDMPLPPPGPLAGEIEAVARVGDVAACAELVRRAYDVAAADWQAAA